MEVILFQIVIAAIIIIVGACGKKERDGITIILVILTLLAVFMTWLILLQLITIAVSYQISSDIEENRNQKSDHQTNYNHIRDSSSGNSLKSCVFLFLIFIAVASAISVLQNKKIENPPPKVTEPVDTFINDAPVEPIYVPLEHTIDSVAEIPTDTIQIEVPFNFDEDESGDPQNERLNDE